MIALAFIAVLVVWSILVVLIVKHERRNAALEAVDAHRIRVICDGLVLVDATVGGLRHHELLLGRRLRAGETVVILGTAVDPRAESRTHSTNRR